jgi:hypothetical protein
MRSLANSWISSTLAAVLLVCTVGCEDRKKASGAVATAASKGKRPSATRVRETKTQPKPELSDEERKKLPRHFRYESLAAAIKPLLMRKPWVIGVGEYHQTKGRRKHRSAIKRFTLDLWPLLATRASDLLVETWVTEGRCGKQEKRIVQKVEKTTQRPQKTENQIISLLKAAKRKGVKPHILTLSCEDYQALTDKKGRLDYARLLGTVTRHLHQKTTSLVALRKKKPLGKRQLVVVYGGALHNDLHPPAGLEPFSYGKKLQQTLKRHYLELDLYVPEYVERDRELAKQAWFPLLKVTNDKEVILVQRSETSYLLLLRRGIKPLAKAKPPQSAK